MRTFSCLGVPAWAAVMPIATIVLAGFAIVALAGRPVISALRRRSFRQHAYEDAPASHAQKTGTPTMGGVLFVLALVTFAVVTMVLGIALTGKRGAAEAVRDAPILLLALGCAAIGFADDYLGIVRGRNRGLRGRPKFALTALVAAAFLFLVPHDVAITTTIALGTLAVGVPAWLWYGLSFLAILATTHSVNLTDGLDGLAVGTIVPPLVLLAWIAGSCDAMTAELGYPAALTAGAALGFLLFNRHPAKVFMGDTGSLLLGGILAGTAIALDQQLLLILIGGVFAAEALSVIIQVSYFKWTKKRIFKMSPLHHHFELSGWPETKVTAVFWAASFGLSVVGFACTRLGGAAP